MYLVTSDVSGYGALYNAMLLSLPPLILVLIFPPFFRYLHFSLFQGVLTVCNHVSAVDDPGVVAALLPLSWFLSPEVRCFGNLCACYCFHVYRHRRYAGRCVQKTVASRTRCLRQCYPTGACFQLSAAWACTSQRWTMSFANSIKAIGFICFLKARGHAMGSCSP